MKRVSSLNFGIWVLLIFLLSFSACSEEGDLPPVKSEISEIEGVAFVFRAEIRKLDYPGIRIDEIPGTQQYVIKGYKNDSLMITRPGRLVYSDSEFFNLFFMYTDLVNLSGPFEKGDNIRFELEYNSLSRMLVQVVGFKLGDNYSAEGVGNNLNDFPFICGAPNSGYSPENSNVVWLKDEFFSHPYASEKDGELDLERTFTGSMEITF